MRLRQGHKHSRLILQITAISKEILTVREKRFIIVRDGVTMAKRILIHGMVSDGSVQPLKLKQPAGVRHNIIMVPV